MDQRKHLRDEGFAKNETNQMKSEGFAKNENNQMKSVIISQYEAAQKKRIHVSILIIFVIIPAVMAAAVYFTGQKFYMLMSLVMLVLLMAPFFMIFENRKPKAREVVLIAMMSAVTVVCHLFFHIILPIQAGTALVIISGISLGPETGFLIGAISRFVCNFYMGQGPWTPWQMFCWGLLGFLGGLAFCKGNPEKMSSGTFKAIMGPVMTIVAAELIAYTIYIFYPGLDDGFVGWRMYVAGAVGLAVGTLLQRKRMPADALTIGLFTFFITFVVYGGIMNVAAMITSANREGAAGISLDTLKALYISGAGYDAMHAFTAAVTAFLIGPDIIRKLERIKIKYGIYK